MENKKMWIWVVIVLVLIGGMAMYTFKNKAEPVVDNQLNEVEGTEDTTPVVEDAQVTNTTKVSLSYADALVKYADKRIQLDSSCQARPNVVTYKDNTGIMIDNRSDQTRTVKVGGTYTIKPYGFKIIILPNITTAPKSILVDCDQSQNVATILVQE